MGRRQAPYSSRSMPDPPNAATRSATNEWIRWRPRPKPILLGFACVLLVVWLAFLLAMIVRQ